MAAIFGDVSNVSSMIPSTVFTGGMSPAGAATGFVPQMILGDFMFSLNSAAYQEFQRQNEYRWESQPVQGAHEVLQYCGPGQETITLPGVIFPTYRGGTGQLDKVRALAAKGKPQMLITATGNMLGEYVIVSVQENQKTFAALGIPLKIEFQIELRSYKAGAGYDQLISAISSMF